MYIGIGLISTLTFFFFLRRENAARSRGERDEVIEGTDGNGQTEVNGEPKGHERNGKYTSVEEAKR